MSKRDIQDVKTVIKDEIHSAMKPFVDRLEKVDHTVLGIEGVGGLIKTVPQLQEQVERIRLSNAKVVAIYGSAAGAIGLVGTLIGKFLLK